MAVRVIILDFFPDWNYFQLFMIYKLTLYFLPSYMSTGLSVLKIATPYWIQTWPANHHENMAI